MSNLEDYQDEEETERLIGKSLEAAKDLTSQALESPSSAVEAALKSFVDTIEAAGGILHRDGIDVPAGDPSWPDLAQDYLAACEALNRHPRVDVEDES